MGKDLAGRIINCLMLFSGPFNELTQLSDELPTPQEGVDFRRKLGAIMIHIDEIMRPIIKEYPELDPDREK